MDRNMRLGGGFAHEGVREYGSGGTMMFNGLGGSIRKLFGGASEEVPLLEISAEAEKQGFKSLNSGINPSIVSNILNKCMINHSIKLEWEDLNGKEYIILKKVIIG